MPGPMDFIFPQKMASLTVNLLPLTLELYWSQRLGCEIELRKGVNERAREGLLSCI